VISTSPVASSKPGNSKEVTTPATVMAAELSSYMVGVQTDGFEERDGIEVGLEVGLEDALLDGGDDGKKEERDGIADGIDVVSEQAASASA
jgi:hypothetical protein